jgi:CHAT domain-containing protein
VLRFAEVGDVPGQAKALIELSRSLDPGEAADVAEQAAALVQDRLPGLACLAQVRLAEVHADDESRQRAALDRAAALVAQVDLPQLRHAVMLTDGLSLLRHGHLDVAVDVLGQALAQVERAASVLPDATLRAAYTGSRTAALTGLVQALLVRDGPGDVAHAARLVDDAHGRTLVAGLLGEVGPRRAHRSGSVRTLLGELDAAYSALFTADRPQQRVLRERIDALEGLIAVQETLTAGSSPSGPATGSAATAPATAAVPSICYQVSGDEILAFVTAGATRVVRHVSSRRRLRDLVEDLERHVGPSAVTLATRHSAQRLSACRAVLEALYVELFAPLAHLLPDRASRTGTGSGQLVVVPDGVLHRVPFNALHDGVAYLLDSWDITLAPSLEAAAHAAARPVRGRRVLAVGVGTDDAPHIETEALAVSRTAAGDHPLLLGADATFDAVREAAQDADVVHLACHGLFRPENPAFSSLRLADRWIRAVDVAGLDLDGRLVVLSACETGRVDDREGDEAIGLARGFLAAGARNVIVSQWLADDRTAAEVMTRVHAFLARGVPPGTALRRAQQAVREVDPHPFHWAPFVVVGAPASSPPEAS